MLDYDKPCNNKPCQQVLEFCQRTANWYLNNQNTEAHPWGGVAGSADQGRYLYQYSPVDGSCEGNGVWGQAVAIMGLLSLAQRLRPEGDVERESALAAARYLMSLQILDQRDERLFGALREHHPQTDWSFPRDGATGAMALCALYRETGEEEYLYRARIFGDWFIRNAFSPSGWPCHTYRFTEHEAKFQPRLIWIWQAGSGLLFYYLYQLTGEKRYLEEGLKPIMESYKQLCADSAYLEEVKQDDFAATTALGALLLYDDKKLLDLIRHRMNITLHHQDEDGSCPGLDGEGVYGLTWMNWVRFIKAKGLSDDTKPFLNAIHKAAAFIPSLQELNTCDLRAYGGLYGQTSFGVSRSLIHHRATGYGLLFVLAAKGDMEVPGYNILGWHSATPEIDFQEISSNETYL